MIKEEIILEQASQPAREQGMRPTCIAFALTEVELMAAPGIQALSPEYLYRSAAQQTHGWLPYAGVPLASALAAATAGQPAEVDFPYQAVEPALPISALPKSFPLFGLPAHHHPTDVAQMIQVLRKGAPVGMGLALTESFYRPVNGVIAFEAEIRPGELHAVTAVGLGWDYGAPSFLIRNSWGAGWGLRGNAWLPGAYVHAHALCIFGV
jgi:hypothetical protein